MQHYPSIHIEASTFTSRKEKNPLVKVCISTFYHQKPIYTFWIPTTSLEKRMGWVPIDIVKARVKRDIGVTFDHHSLTNT